MEQPRSQWAALHWEAAGQQRGGGRHLPRRPAYLEATARRRKGDGRTLIGDSGNGRLLSLRRELLNAAGHRFRWRRRCPLCNGCNAGRPFKHGWWIQQVQSGVHSSVCCQTRGLAGAAPQKCTTAPAAAGHVRPPWQVCPWVGDWSACTSGVFTRIVQQQPQKPVCGRPPAPHELCRTLPGTLPPSNVKAPMQLLGGGPAGARAQR